MSRGPLKPPPAAALAVVAVLALAGCGERSFDAEDLVADLNAAGAGIELGETLSDTEGTTVVAIDLPAEEASGDHAADAHEHTAGAIVILDDSDAAAAEFSRCEEAVDFVCFRAANAVLRFTGLTAEEQARITAAVSSLETG